MTVPPANPPRPGGIIASWSGTAYSTRQVWLISQLTSISEGLSPIRHPGTRLVGDGRPTTELEVAYSRASGIRTRDLPLLGDDLTTRPARLSHSYVTALRLTQSEVMALRLTQSEVMALRLTQSEVMALWMTQSYVLALRLTQYYVLALSIHVILRNSDCTDTLLRNSDSTDAILRNSDSFGTILRNSDSTDNLA